LLAQLGRAEKMRTINESTVFKWDGLQRSLSDSLKSGIFISSFLKTHALLSGSCNNWNILDFGCGAGGLSAALSVEGFLLNAIEINEDQMPNLRYWQNEYKLSFKIIQYSDFMDAPSVGMYDLCILGDVLEHIEDISVLFKVLNCSRRIFLTTPNKHSLLLSLRDPHFGLPVFSMLTKEQVVLVKKYFNKTINTTYRYAGLYSTFEINKMLANQGYTKISNLSKKYYEFKENRKILNVVSNLLPNFIFDSFIAPEIVIYAEKCCE
jgi:2-polyprenyl-3-methyl-5-hydroxy-6-metoxy-1,4-benzoquinol methylase